MIDVHTHICEFQDSLEIDRYFTSHGSLPAATLDAYIAAIEGAERAVLLALDAKPAGFYMSNEATAWVARQTSGRVIGFASVQPLGLDAPDALERAVHDLGLRGLKIAPMYQRFAPDDPKVFPIYERAVRLGIPIIFHQGTSYLGREAALEESWPVRLDRVAREYPELRLVIAHLGYPWGGEVVALLRKHPHVYADCSALAFRPWFLFNSLLNAHEYGVLDKVLFGSDYPGMTTVRSRDAVLAVAEMTHGTKLPSIPAERLRALVERDSLAALGVKP